MEIRKFTGEADGWLVAVGKRNATCWDDEGAPCTVSQGRKYYIKGDVDSGLFDVEGTPKDKGKKPKAPELPEEYDTGEDKEEDK